MNPLVNRHNPAVDIAARPADAPMQVPPLSEDADEVSSPLSSPKELLNPEQPDRSTRLETQAKIRERRIKCDFPE